MVWYDDDHTVQNKDDYIKKFTNKCASLQTTYNFILRIIAAKNCIYVILIVL